jgi:hypothetical protein
MAFRSRTKASLEQRRELAGASHQEAFRVQHSLSLSTHRRMSRKWSATGIEAVIQQCPWIVAEFSKELEKLWNSRKGEFFAVLMSGEEKPRKRQQPAPGSDGEERNMGPMRVLFCVGSAIHRSRSMCSGLLGNRSKHGRKILCRTATRSCASFRRNLRLGAGRKVRTASHIPSNQNLQNSAAQSNPASGSWPISLLPNVCLTAR